MIEFDEEQPALRFERYLKEPFRSGVRPAAFRQTVGSESCYARPGTRPASSSARSAFSSSI